ncbi:MAG: DUF4405 domain-containing protein [Caldilineaceae bacterium]|nr:DUF4405 domain-containing protein [Caldilineaceae bacterium]
MAALNPVRQRQTQPQRTGKVSRNQVNLFLDIFLLALFAAEMEEHFTGLRLHELLGLLFTGLLVIHIVLHWQWIVSLTRTFFHRLLHESRLNYVINLLLLIDMVAVAVTGIFISRTLGLTIPFARNAMQFWKMAHIFSAQLVLALVALHVAMHWKWIINACKRYLFRVPSLSRGTERKPLIGSPAPVFVMEKEDSHVRIPR